MSRSGAVLGAVVFAVVAGATLVWSVAGCQQTRGGDPSGEMMHMGGMGGMMGDGSSGSSGTDGKLPAWKAPASAADQKNPVPANSQSVASGKSLFDQYCAACHGKDGKGNGPVANALKVHPTDLADPKMWDQTDGALHWKIEQGKAPMPGYNSLLASNQIWDLVDYIRTLAPKPKK